MDIRAVVLDIGGVLEVLPPALATTEWERRLELRPGRLDEQLSDVWVAGSIGDVSEAAVHRAVGDRLRLDEARVAAFMADIWAEYLGTLNAELAAYFRDLRPRYRTAMLSNSFVGAREREQQRYGFEEMADLIVYSHEVGMSKPDSRIYRLTCDRLGVQPAETLFVDDVEEYVDAAREVGLQAILFKDNAQALAEMERRLGRTR